MKIQYSIARIALPWMAAASALLACQSCWSGDDPAKGSRNELHPVKEAAKAEVIEIPGRQGKIGLRAMVMNGKLEGLSEQWWDDGTPMSRGYFRQGVMVDSAYSWDMEGRIHGISVYEDGNPISTEIWYPQGGKKYWSVRVKDSTYHTMRWNEAGEKIKDTLETHPKVRWIKDAPAKDRRQVEKGYE